MLSSSELATAEHVNNTVRTQSVNGHLLPTSKESVVDFADIQLATSM